jgi:hypothetical protein
VIRERPLRARRRLVGKLPITGELLRGSRSERTVRHAEGVSKVRAANGVKYLS